MFIQLKNIERIYRKGSLDIFALQQVNLTIEEGEFVAIMGPSGSGKSTLLHLLGCLDRATRGEYYLDGIDVARLDDAQLSQIRNQKIGFVFQAFHLLSQHTVLQNIISPLFYRRVSSSSMKENRWAVSAEFKRQARRIAEYVGLGERLHHRPSELSGGEMQRVAIARALVSEPRVILADEPTGNLDSHTGQEIMRLFQELHSHGRTIIVVTHEQSVAQYAARIIFLKDGEVERTAFGERFFAAEPANSPPGRGKGWVAESDGTTNPFTHPNPSQEGNSGLHPGSVDKKSPGWRGTFYRLLMVTSTALHGVLLHKLRSFLSILGIVFGIGAIIAMMAIGAGAKQEILEQIELLGMANITVRAVLSAEDSLTGERGQLSQGVTYNDVERIIQGVPFILSLAAVRVLPAQVQYQRQTAQARLVGTSADYPATANISIRQGRFLMTADEQEMQRVCVLGATIRQTLFAFQDPVGKMVKIRNDWFRVVGTIENKELNLEKLPALQMGNVNNDVYIPLSTSSMFVPPEESDALQEISVRVDAPGHVDTVAQIIRTVLDRVHHGARDYEVIVPRELLQQSQQAQNVFNLVMGCIAGISLLVGGIGIMNIMLATVTERTREIGIRRAIGASRRMILLQFLLESLLLTFVGGCLGIVLGIGGAYLISVFAQWRTIISFQTVLFAWSISSLIGIVFGLYPASQGADMNPITALRYE